MNLVKLKAIDFGDVHKITFNVKATKLHHIVHVHETVLTCCSVSWRWRIPDEPYVNKVRSDSH